MRSMLEMEQNDAKIVRERAHLEDAKGADRVGVGGGDVDVDVFLLALAALALDGLVEFHPLLGVGQNHDGGVPAKR